MGTGYTRNDTANNIADGNVINASDLDGEFDALQAAFNASTGHSHDGTSGEGPQINTAGIADDAVTAAKLDDTASFTMAGLTVSGAVALNGSTTIGNADTDTVTVTADVASSLVPSADETYDLGASGSEWNDLYITGTANIDALVADTADINAGSIDGVTIGTNSAVTDLRVDNIQIDGNTISSTDTAGDITLSPDGIGDIHLDADTVRVGDSGVDATITTNGAGDIIINTNAGSSSGTIRIYDGADGNINLTPNGTGSVVISKADIDGGAIDATNIGASTAGTGNFSTLSIDGTAITSTATELNALDGVTSTAAELNLVDGSVAGTVTNSKAVIYGASGEVNATTLQIGGNSITATAAELNILDGVTADATELNILDGVTATTAELNYNDVTTLGTIEASKTVTADSSGEVQMPDDKKLYFGTNDDAHIMYDETTDDRLEIGGASVFVEKNAQGTQTTVDSVSGTATIDLANSNHFKITTDENTDIDFGSTRPTGQSGIIVLVNTTPYTITTSQSDVKSVATDLTTISASGTYLITYYCDGTNVYLSASGAMV